MPDAPAERLRQLPNNPRQKRGDVEESDPNQHECPFPGGLCISGTVYDQIKTRLALGYEDLGAQAVKNIAEPVRVYRVQLEPGAAVPAVREREEKVKPKVSFEVGETVKVADGPFQNQSGIVEEIDPERGKLRVSVTIFGRATPVELDFEQVERSK